tara:strand:+ start:6024 stop:8231 length:2208 start_codon:yes stop_codon:yes gene_type:complete
MAAAPGADMSGLANLMAMKGRKGDNTLVHMSKSELPYLNMLARSAGHPRGLPVNPETGLPEANILKSILPIAGSILGGMFLAPMLPAFLGTGALATGVGAGLGSFGGGLLSGQSLKDAAIGGLLSGGLSGLGAATFGGQSLMGTDPAGFAGNPAAAKVASDQATKIAAQRAGSSIADVTGAQISEAGQLGAFGMPEAAGGSYTTAPNMFELNAGMTASPASALSPTGVNASVPSLAPAVPAPRLAPPDLTQEIGFTDMEALYNYRPEIPKLDYLKYAAKPAMTAGAVGLGVDAALERGAFEPIDYSSSYDAAEMERPSPLPKRGLRFESERTGAFPRTAEEALAFAQPGGGRQRFFNQRFALPAKTGGGIAALQTGGRTAFSAAFEEEEKDGGEVGLGAPPSIGGIGMDSADAAGLVGGVLGLGLGVPGLGIATNALGQAAQLGAIPEAQRGSLQFDPLSLFGFGQTLGQQHTNLTTQNELNAPLQTDQEAAAAAAQAAALASTLASIDQATLAEAEEAAPAPATAAAFGLADTEAAAQGAVAAAQDAAVAQANAAQGIAATEAGIGGGSAGVGGFGSDSGPGSGYGDEGFGGIGGEDGDADGDGGGADSAGDDGPGGTGGSDDYQYGGLVQLPEGGLISAYQMGGSPSPYFEGRVTGPGDGMSDSIPFSIEGQQPAILSRDEYVLPADIVSMMGNGSSDAGAGKIDSFINDFRMQKYGRGEQPPETSRGLSSIR